MGTGRALLCAVAVALLVAAPAGAVPPIEDLVVAPEGSKVVRAADIGIEVEPTTESFLDAHEGIDVTTVAVDTAVIRSGDGLDWTLVTVVRLASPAEAEAALHALLEPGPGVEPLGPPVHGVGRRRVEITPPGGLPTVGLLEALRAVGPDLVTWAALQGSDPAGFIGAAVEAHLDAHPPQQSFGWLVPVAIGGGVLLLGTCALVLRRRPAPSRESRVATLGSDGTTGRLNW